jgi:RimJ/RimL family protein N-acetyltransferase
LLLRSFRHDDAGPLVKMVANDEDCTLPVTETNVDQWIESQLEARFTRSESGVYLAIELVEGHELAGFVLPSYTDREHSSAGFLLTISPARRRQGLGLEASRAAIDFAFDGLCARRVAVWCSGQNAASRGMLEKAGMRKEGVFVKSWFDGNEWVNVLWYAMLKEERASRA